MPDAPREIFGPSEYGPSIIGSTVVMRGELTLAEDLTIEGTFVGPRIDGVRYLSIGARVLARP